MSTERQTDPAGLARPVALAATLEPLSRLVSFSRAIVAEPVMQRMLRVATRELTLMLNAEACLVSRIEDGLLREVADYSSSERQVARGLSYYLADYPTTAAVLGLTAMASPIKWKCCAGRHRTARPRSCPTRRATSTWR